MKVEVEMEVEVSRDGPRRVEMVEVVEDVVDARKWCCDASH